MELKTDMSELLEACKALARQAGDATMDVYRSDDFGVELKEDAIHSPVTRADKLANHIIEDGLEQISDYPVISEEGKHSAGGASSFWLVDPLDGTKQFIKREGGFSVNIGLVENAKPVMGVVYAPLEGVMYFGVSGHGAWKQLDAEEPVPISATFRERIPIVASRRQLNEATQKFLKGLGEHRLIYPGPSLRFCMVAEGRAAFYPRFAPCFLWDTAAAHAILQAAGGMATDLNGRELTYHPSRTLESPHFIAAAKGMSKYRAVP